MSDAQRFNDEVQRAGKNGFDAAVRCLTSASGLLISLLGPLRIFALLPYTLRREECDRRHLPL
jgi:hypothetical protein